MSIKGRPALWLDAALDRGDLALAISEASELERVPLATALRILALIAEKQPDRYEPAAVRWLGRYLLEQADVGLDDAGVALAALDQLAHHPPTSAVLARMVS